MFQSVLGAITSDLALDLGTCMTRVVVPGRGVVSCEPSLVAIQDGPDGRRHVIAVGDEARAMEGRAPSDIHVVRPIADGVIADFEVAEAMLRHLMVEVQGRRLWVGPRVAVCIPYGTTELEKRALRESAEASGAREVFLVEQPIAAAVGMDLPMGQPRGHLVVDVGGAMTQVAVISLGGVVHARTVKVGGLAMDQAIVHHLREVHGLVVGMPTAEALKIAHGAATGPGGNEPVHVRGKDKDDVFPREMALDPEELCEALEDPVRMVCEAVVGALEKTPPDLASDIGDSGILLTGGSALLRRLDVALRDATGLPVVVPDDPGTTVARGAGRILEDAWMLDAAAC